MHALAEALWRCVEDGVFTEDHALVHVALAHWAELLRSPDPARRRRGLRVVLALLETGRPFPVALAHMVVRATRDDPSGEAILVRSGVEAHVSGDAAQLGDRIGRLAEALRQSDPGAARRDRPRQRQIGVVGDRARLDR